MPGGQVPTWEEVARQHGRFLYTVAYRLTGQYAIHRFRRLREEFASVLRGVALMGLFVVATTFGLQDRYESRATFLIFFLAYIVAPLRSA